MLRCALQTFAARPWVWIVRRCMVKVHDVFALRYLAIEIMES